MKMIKNNKSTIAFTIGMFNAIDGPAYCVYTQAYGMQMSVSEWPLNILMMAPPHLVSCMTKDADIVSAGLIPGASYTPGDGNYDQIRKNKGKWVLARPTDDVQRIVAEKLGVLLLFEKANEVKMISEVEGFTSDNLIVALQTNSVSTVESIKKVVSSIRKKMPSHCSDAKILVSGSFECSNLIEYSSIDGVSGLLLLDASFDAVLTLVERITG